MTERELVARADAMRPLLLEEQAATEERGFYSAETHEAFKEAGFYRIHVPRRYGGLEQSVTTFYKLIMSVSRGCASTGWMLSLGAGHAQQAAAFFDEQAQDAFFGNDGHFVASASFAYENALAVPVDGGYLVRGTWHFCSGVPYATHHMAMVPTKTGEIGVEDLLVVMFERQQFQRLDNWGDLIGLKGSGSHSVVVEETFVPSSYTVPFVELEDGGPTVGYGLHGNPLYGGRFSGFAVGRLTAVQVGNAQAAVDEYERLLVGKKTFSITNHGMPKTEDPNYQRCLGLALAWTDSAYSILLQAGDQYLEYSRRSVEEDDPFTEEKSQRIYGQQMTAAQLCWQAGETVFRAASTTGARDGQRMQRYWRDLCAFRTNGIHQHDFRASALAQAHLGLPVVFL